MSEQKWKLVPVEPTEEMLRPLDRFMRPEAARELLKEVLAAAPQPPELGGEPEVLGYVDHALTYYPSPESVAQYGRGRFMRELVDRAHFVRLHAEVERLKEITCTSMGVGDGNGQLIVHGDYDSIKAAQRILWERDDLKARTAELEGRLHKATAFVQGLRDAAGSQPSVATGYLQDILDDLSSAEGAKS